MDIDYKNEILYGRLQRMAPRSAEIGPALKDYWVVSIDPKNSPKILNLIKTQFQYTSESLRHLKRMFKVKDQQGSDKLKVLICPVEDSYTTFDELKLLLETTLQQETDVPIEKCKIPMNKPLDKEMNIQWTNMYWPLLWKGNPLIQDLNEIYKQIDISKVDKYMKLVADLSKKGDGKNIVTIFVDASNDEIKAQRYDERTSLNPIKHSIMDGIADIASDELSRRKDRMLDDKNANNYLCLNYHVYTSHEPCTMCAMALVHSRISQLVYLKPSLGTGGIGENSGNREMIHLSCALNWKYESFQYLDTGLAQEVAEMDPHLYI